MAERNSRNPNGSAKRYRPQSAQQTPEYTLEIDCPLCGRRICDLSKSSKEPFWVGLKCPHCHKIVDLQCMVST